MMGFSGHRVWDCWCLRSPAAGCDGEKGRTWPTDPGPTVVTGAYRIISLAGDRFRSAGASRGRHQTDSKSSPSLLPPLWDVQLRYYSRNSQILRGFSASSCKSCFQGGKTLTRQDLCYVFREELWVVEVVAKSGDQERDYW